MVGGWKKAIAGSKPPRTRSLAGAQEALFGGSAPCGIGACAGCPSRVITPSISPAPWPVHESVRLTPPVCFGTKLAKSTMNWQGWFRHFTGPEPRRPAGSVVIGSSFVENGWSATCHSRPS